jgi:hypothetical protein
MFVRLRVLGFESSVNKDFLNENDILIQMKKLKIIQSSCLESVGDTINFNISMLRTLDLFVLTSLDQQLFKLKILYTFFAKQATFMRRSMALSLRHS